MQTFEGNLNHFIDDRGNVASPYAGDDRLPVVFYMGAMRQDALSEQEGRPIFRDEEFIKIYINKDEILVHPVSDVDRQRWPRQYAAWKATGANEPGMTGTPLANFPLVSRAQVEELRYFKIFTVEQLAEIPDTTAQQIPGVTKLKQQAAAHVMIAREQAPLQKLNEELQSRDAKIEALEAQVAELLARMPPPPQETRQAAPARAR